MFTNLEIFTKFAKQNKAKFVEFLIFEHLNNSLSKKDLFSYGVLNRSEHTFCLDFDFFKLLIDHKLIFVHDLLDECNFGYEEFVSILKDPKHIEFVQRNFHSHAQEVYELLKSSKNPYAFQSSLVSPYYAKWFIEELFDKSFTKYIASIQNHFASLSPSIPQPLYKILGDEELFEFLCSNSLIGLNDVQYLIATLRRPGEIFCFIKNPKLLTYTLENFLLTREDLNIFDDLFKKDSLVQELCSKKHIDCGFFSYLRASENLSLSPSDFEKVQELSLRYEKILEFESTVVELNLVEKQNLLRLLRISQCFDKFQYILENQIENVFASFSDLKSYLCRSDKKLSMIV